MNKFLWAFLLTTIVICSCEPSTQSHTNKAVVNEQNSKSSEALAWLYSIFECENDENQFCFPNEGNVLTESFQEFLMESNQFLRDTYDLNSIEKNYLTKKLEKKWSNYKLLEEETWAFGRGNGDVKYLENVEIEPLGNMKYFVKIDYSDDFSTINQVQLIKTEHGFLIDFIETEYETSSTIASNNENPTNIERFTQKWTWTYKNETEEDLLDTYKGEISAYYNPKTKKWLFTKESYGNSGEMVNWVIGDANGKFIYSFQSVHAEEPHSIMDFYAEEPHYTFELEELYKPLQQTKIFNQGSEFGEIIGNEFERIYHKNTINSTRVFLGTTDADMTAFYGFDKVDSETKLLYTFEWDQKDVVYLKEKSVLDFDKKEVSLDFLGITKVDKIIELDTL